MNIKDLQHNWNSLAETDPLWAVLTESGKSKNRWSRDEFFATGVHEIDTLMATIQTLPVHLSYGRALDFGCGVGRLSQALANYFDKVVGVDIAPAMIKQADEFNQKGTHCTYRVNETNDLAQFEDASFDLVHSHITLQHMEPHYAKNYIKEFLRVLKRDGLLVFQIPSEPANTLKGYIIRVTPRKLLNKYRKMEMHGIQRKQMQHFLEQQGANVIHMQKETGAGSGWNSYRYFVTKKI